MPQADTVAIIPAKNEAPSIAGVIGALRELGIDAVVVDDMSTDATRETALKNGATVLPLSVHLGAWGSTQAGFRYALKHGYTYALTLDADGQHPPESAPDLLTPLHSREADVVIGACPGRVSDIRALAWSMFRRLSGISVEDMTSGYKAYTRDAMQAALDDSAYLLDYQDIGTLLVLTRAGMRIIERPVPMCERQDGSSRIFSSWLSIAEYMVKTLLLCATKARRRKPTEKHA